MTNRWRLRPSQAPSWSPRHTPSPATPLVCSALSFQRPRTTSFPAKTTLKSPNLNYPATRTFCFDLEGHCPEPGPAILGGRYVEVMFKTESIHPQPAKHFQNRRLMLRTVCLQTKDTVDALSGRRDFILPNQFLTSDDCLFHIGRRETRDFISLA